MRHDIGKNLFKIMLETEGFEVIDLGHNVSGAVFIEKTRELRRELTQSFLDHQVPVDLQDI